MFCSRSTESEGNVGAGQRGYGGRATGTWSASEIDVLPVSAYRFAGGELLLTGLVPARKLLNLPSHSLYPSPVLRLQPLQVLLFEDVTYSRPSRSI